MAEIEGREEGDVFFSGALFYKSGTWTPCQQYTAQLKFESTSGPKRLDLYPLQGNKRFPGTPTLTVRLTHVLGINNGKQHALSRSKHTFQIMTTEGRHQFGARSHAEKTVWTNKLEQILHHMPLDNRTYEFHVTVFPTKHSDKLHLNGQYVLKVTEREIQLFSASGSLPSQFWSPLGSVHKAHQCVLPASGTPAQQHGVGGGANGLTTRTLLIITTERTAPIGQGGFAFFTESAKDIAATITQRRETRIKERSAAVSPSIEDEDSDTSVVDTGTKKRPDQIPMKKKLQGMKSLPISPSTERDDDDLRGRAREDAIADDGAETTKQKEREQASLRVCARKKRIIPIRHQMQKESLHHHSSDICLVSHTSSPFTPDEPHITNKELAGHQHEWKQMKQQNGGKDENKVHLRGRIRRLNWTKKKSFTITSPVTEETASFRCSSSDCEYVIISRAQRISRDEDEESDHGESSLGGKMKGLERQRKIDVVSPTRDADFLSIRPRTNAFSEAVTASPKQQRRKQSLENRLLGGERGESPENVWQCNEETCFLAPRRPILASTQQKSSSDPQLSNRRSFDLTTSHVYLTILPPDSPKKAPKKPVPTPRTHKLVPENVPLYENTFHMTPPTPTLNLAKASDHKPVPSYPRMGLGALLSSQRSLSESNLSSIGGTSHDADDEYVDMTEFRGKFFQQLYVSYTDLHGQYENLMPLHDPEMTFRGGMQQEKSSSVGDIPQKFSSQGAPTYENTRYVASFLETEKIYENGQHCMEHYLYGNTSGNQDNTNFHNGNSDHETTEPGSHGDSGLGSTPSCSPLLSHHSSLDDARRTSNTTHRQHGAEETSLNHKTKAADEPRQKKAGGKPCKWRLPCCMSSRGQAQHTCTINHYENLPLMGAL